MFLNWGFRLDVVGRGLMEVVRVQWQVYGGAWLDKGEVWLQESK